MSLRAINCINQEEFDAFYQDYIDYENYTRHGAHYPGKSWNVLEFKFWPGMSLNLGEFESLSWNVLKNIKIINET